MIVLYKVIFVLYFDYVIIIIINFVNLFTASFVNNQRLGNLLNVIYCM